QVGALRTRISAASAFGSAAQLRERNHRNAQFFRQSFQSAGNRRDLLRPILITPATAGHELQVIHDEQIESTLRLLQASRFGAHFAESQAGSVIDENGSV